MEGKGANVFIKEEVRETRYLHVWKDVVQLGPWADVAQEHVIHLWSEVLLGDGVILQRETAKWPIKWLHSLL